MNKFQRVKNAIQGLPVDRVPASFWFHFPPEKAGGHAMAQAHLDYYQAVGQDFLKVMNDNGYALEGVEGLRGKDDWLHLRPTPLTARPYQQQLDGLKEILDTLGSEVPIITTVFNPFCTANDNRGGALDESDADLVWVTQQYRQAPAAVKQGMQVIAESLAQFARACVEAGAGGIYLSAIGGERNRFSPQEFAEWVEPFDRMVLQAAQDAGAWFNLVHMCGGGLRLENYANYPAHAFNWAVQKDNLGLPEGKKLFKRTLLGGMDERGVLVDGSREEIEFEVARVMEEAPSTGFMLGAGCTLPGDVPWENLKIILKAR